MINLNYTVYLLDSFCVRLPVYHPPSRLSESVSLVSTVSELLYTRGGLINLFNRKPASGDPCHPLTGRARLS